MIESNRTQIMIEKQDGFTLVDVSIMLLVIGLIVSPMILAYHNWDKRERREGTSADILTIEEEIERYYFTNRRYPCPSDPTLSPANVGFGEEARDAAGACVVASLPDSSGNVFYGAVPFKALGLEYEESLDGWKNKLTYGVTQILTTAGTFNAANGAIRINQPNELRAVAGGEQACAPIQNNPNTPEDESLGFVNNIHLIVLSHGSTGTGAYNYNGIRAACPPAGTTVDAENCNFANDTFEHNECRASDVAGVNFYDDMMYTEYAGNWNQEPSDLWEPGDDAGELGSQAGLFGIGTDDPQRNLDVIGNIKITNTDTSTDATDEKTGSALAGEFCDSDGNNCFAPESITGYDANLDCGGGSAYTGIANNAAGCIDAISIPSTISRRSCSAGEYMTGFDAGGDVICAVAP